MKEKEDNNGSSGGGQLEEDDDGGKAQKHNMYCDQIQFTAHEI